MRQARVADECCESACADLATADVLMAIELRTVRRLAVVVVDHHQLLEADAPIKLAHEALHVFIVGESNPSTP